MKIDIISGFLGAGKTTLIKKLLNDSLKNERIAIIENEYGEIGIDGGVLKQENVEIKEITSGCICCNIRGDFKDKILDIIKAYRPERIIIEPSGVAKFSQVINSIRSANIEGCRINMKITVVDSQNVKMYTKNFGEFYKNQIINANTIILSKSQYLSDKELRDICEVIKGINKKCTLITTPWENISSDRILEVAEEKVESLISDRSFKKSANFRQINSTALETFDNWGVETVKIFNVNEIKSILRKLEVDTRCGEVLRAKGIVNTIGDNWVKFDFVPNDIQVSNYSSDYTGRICVIGRKLDKDYISKLFLE